MSPPSLRERASGILLHVTSLPGPHGIGDLGPAAHAFVDALARAGQGWWQMLPIVPAGKGHSPYDSPSAFAGHPLLISLEGLQRDGLLRRSDLRPSRPFPSDRVAYQAAARFKEERLRRSYRSFRPDPAFEQFRVESADWLDPFCLFSAIRKRQRGAPWWTWPTELRDANPTALREARRRLREEIRYQEFLQFVFDRQWRALHDYARGRGVGLIGDVPVFVSHDSADVWSHREIFFLDSRGRATLVAGVPPDYFSKTGQLWGNPLYRWDVLRRKEYAWWIERLRWMCRRFDALRLDHFIGFQRNWAVRGGARTARRGEWRPGPADGFFRAVRNALGPLEMMAEDLGLVTSEVKALRDRLDLPGLRVLQFAFGQEGEANDHLPHLYSRRCVVLTGTHDNDTIVGWFRDRGRGRSLRSAPQARRERDHALRYVGTRGREFHWDMIRLALMSVADTAIIPMQDLLGLGSEARMNRPGTERGNWEWRIGPGELRGRTLKRLRDLTILSSRLPSRLRDRPNKA